MTDLDLLRRYEPIARFTDGELFFPRAVDGYVRGASLWSRDATGRTEELVPRGALDLDLLAARGEAPAGHTLYLRFVAEPLSVLDYQHWAQRPERVPFRAPGRLARVSFLSRLADSAFKLSLLLRGKVPGGTAAAAEIATRALAAQDPRLVYYGRVVREGGWIALHYLFFYPMNDWRSGFHGVNDHEADWEQVFVYLADRGEDEEPEPRWVAYASHDFQGDDLRRRWDDPLLHREGEHPVIFVGAGSHASYFEQGEYVMGVEPQFLTRLRGMINRARLFWVETLGQGDADPVRGGASGPFSIPFVDYARGDGARIGPGQGRTWSPVLISDAEPWVDSYRGLWGLDTRDQFGGERAPSGPKYNRDGSIRLSWSDPLGWAGLDKVSPPPEVPALLAARQRELDAEIAEREETLRERREAVRTLALDVAALRTAEYHSALYTKKARELADQERELRGLRALQVEARETRMAIRGYRERVAAGDVGDPQAHLHHVHHPVPILAPQHRIVQFWGAISGMIGLLIIVMLVVVAPPHWWLLLPAVVLGLMAIEAIVRGRIADFLLNVVIVLAVVASLLLFWEFWRVALVIALLGVVIYVLRENLRELSQR